MFFFFMDSGQAVPSSLPVEDQEKLLDILEETLEIRDSKRHGPF